MKLEPAQSGMPARPRDHLLLRLSHSVRPPNRPALVTLKDAVCFIKELDEPRRRLPVWEHAVDKLVDAAMYGQKADIEAATWRFEIALRQENSPP